VRYFPFFGTFDDVHTSLDPIAWKVGIINEQLIKCYVEQTGVVRFQTLFFSSPRGTEENHVIYQ
jgi:hypothetical protein